MSFLYRVVLFKDITKVVGAPPTNDADKTDFETNRQSSALSIRGIESQEAFIVDLTYADFTAKITGIITNADIKYTEDDSQYVLYIEVLDTVTIQSTTAKEKPSFPSESTILSKGSVNTLTIKPVILTENMTDDANVMQTVGGSVTDVGQVFKLTDGVVEIDQIKLTMEAISGSSITAIDDFESYADTTALRGTWLSSDLSNTPNTLETSIIHAGSQAMKIQLLSKTKSKDEIKKTFGATQDWSSDTAIQLWFRNDSVSIVEIQIIDSTGDGIKSTLTVSSSGVFEFIKINFSDMIPVGATPADLSVVKDIIFKITNINSIGAMYIDDLEVLDEDALGTLDIEIHDFGATSNPTTLGTVLTTKTVTLVNGKMIYEVDLGLNGLTGNNFYGIVITNPSIATVKIYGNSASNKYTNGFAFDSTDDTNIAETATGDDINFEVYCLDVSSFHGICIALNASGGNSSVTVSIENTVTKKKKAVLMSSENLMSRNEILYFASEITDTFQRMTKDEEIIIEYADEATSAATRLQATVFLAFIDRIING